MSTTEARWFSFAGRMIAVAGLTVGSAMLFGQSTQVAQDGSVTSAAAAVARTATQQMPLLNLKDSGTDAAFSSSSSSADDAAAATTEVAANTADHFNFANAMQYGGGRSRYGRPRYRGGNTNADGSAKYDFFVGAGYDQPLGNTYHYFSPDWSFQVGGGRNFNKHVGVNLEFNWDNLNVNGRTLSDESNIYFSDPNPYDNGLDANAHIWSFSLNPIYNLRSGEGLGAYITGGVGFYHKVTNFTLPEEEDYCDYYYGCEEIEVNGTFDHYISNAPGVNGGIGFTYKFSRFSNERLYAEFRYVVTFNSQRQGLTNADIVANPNYAYSGSNFFPANSNRTTILPVNFGIRF